MEEEADQIRILFDDTGLAKIGKRRAAVLERPALNTSAQL